MKKKYLICFISGIVLICVLYVCLEARRIKINEENFPDAAFRAYIDDKYGADGVLSVGEIDNITRLELRDKKIKSLEGVQFFTKLKELYCSGNQLTSLDVSKNTELKKLDCQENQLTYLDVSKNTKLTGLACNGNQLTSLDVSKNTELRKLWCQNNKLTYLDVSNNMELTELDYSGNQLTSLDVSKNTELNKLDSRANRLSSLEGINVSEEAKKILSDEELNKRLWNAFGARTDSTGTYFQNRDVRAYVRTDGNHNGFYGITYNDISCIYKLNVKGDTISNLYGYEYESAFKSIVDHFFLEYPEKEKGQGYYDYISDDKGNPIGYSIGKFTDLGNFTNVAKEDLGGEIEFIIYPTKDLKGYNIIGIRPVGVRCSLGLDGKVRVYGPIIYHKGAKWKSLTKKDEYVNRQPICILCRVSLTPLATIEAFKLLSFLKSTGEIIKKDRKFLKYNSKGDLEELSKEELKIARKFRIIRSPYQVGFFKTWGWLRIFGEDISSKYILTMANYKEISKKNTHFDIYFNHLGISNSKSDREKYYHDNRERFVIENGLLYGPGYVRWGYVKNKNELFFFDNDAFKR